VLLTGGVEGIGEAILFVRWLVEWWVVMSKIGTEYHTTVKGSALRTVVCEKCQTEFVYVLKRQVLGTAISVLDLNNRGAQEQAVKRANANLRKVLARDQDPVPCPGCGWYQQSMIPLLRQAHRQGMSFTGRVLLYFAALLLLLFIGFRLGGESEDRKAPLSLVQAAACIGSLGLGLILTRKLLARRLRPNEGDPEARIELGRRLAMKKDERTQPGTTGQQWGTGLPEGQTTLSLPIDPVLAGVAPVFCPRCTAVLQPWVDGVRELTCPHCGERVRN
jgi:hypothetical protein